MDELSTDVVKLIEKIQRRKAEDQALEVKNGATRANIREMEDQIAELHKAIQATQVELAEWKKEIEKAKAEAAQTRSAGHRDAAKEITQTTAKCDRVRSALDQAAELVRRARGELA